jgi:MoaA/NifB/PqqE/SkfB family radical SAM enzyme
MKKAVVFGVGKRWNHFKNEINNEYALVAFSDNDSDKQGCIIDGIPVLKPCSIIDIDFDIILIMPSGNAAINIYNQLKSFGIDECRIKKYDKQVSPLLIDADFFTENLTIEQKKELFKNNIELVFIELNSQCNRRCWMCTDSVIDRRSENIKLPQKILVKLLLELQEINYNCDISLSVFNEPMIDEDLENNIKLIKKYLPNAPLHFNTNGDFLTIERLKVLETLGLDFLPISLYIDTIEKPWNYNDSVKAIERATKKLELEILEISENNDIITNCVCQYKSLPVIFRCANHRIVAGDRCGSIPETAPVKRFEKALRICDRPFTQFTVNYNCDVTMCSNFHPNFDGHLPYIAGNIEISSIFDIYTSENWTAFRKKHIGDINSTICKTCGIISDIWGNKSLSILPFQPFRDRPRYRN